MPRYKGTKYEVDGVITADDMSAALDLVIDAMERHNGLAKYENTEKGFEDFQAETVRYMRHVQMVNSEKPEESAHFMPTVEGWTTFLGISRVTLGKYTKRGEKWQQYIDVVKNGILSVKAQLASVGKFPPVLFMFDACNNGTYYNTNEFRLPQHEPRQIQQAMSNEQIQQQILGVAPELPDGSEGKTDYEIGQDDNGSTQPGALYNFEPDQGNTDPEA